MEIKPIFKELLNNSFEKEKSGTEPNVDEAIDLFNKLNDSRIRRGLESFTPFEQEHIVKTIRKEIEDRQYTNKI